MLWKKVHIFSILLFIFGTSLFPDFAYLQVSTNPDELKNKIEERNTQIKQLEEEINKYNLEVLNANAQAKTLQGTIKTLDLTKKKINTDIQLTESKISKTNLTISQLGEEIGKTEEHMNLNKQSLINAIKKVEAIEDIGIVEMFLSSKSISDVWLDIDNIRQVQETIRDKSRELAVLKSEMEDKQVALGGQKQALVGLKEDLSGKKQAVEYTVKEQATLLTQTKNKEQAYKELVKTKEQQKEQFEKEIFEYESQLNFLIDKGSYPRPKNGILSWPLDTVYLTQRFGKTVGAEKLYTSGSHNGVDFRASIGTRVINVLDGVVVGSGNTDIYPGCYSFGKWVMVKHNNGLSTIYAHLSVISVSNNQVLKTGDLIGYSGNTGYSTGPHLHVSLYATQGVRIERFVNSRGCKQAVLPLADIRAYLDPLDYFPSI